MTQILDAVRPRRPWGSDVVRLVQIVFIGAPFAFAAGALLAIHANLAGPGPAIGVPLEAAPSTSVSVVPTSTVRLTPAATPARRKVLVVLTPSVVPTSPSGVEPTAPVDSDGPTRSTSVESDSAGPVESDPPDGPDATGRPGAPR